MKTLTICGLATAALITLSACESDGEHGHDHDRGGRTTTTTTEETTTHRPVEQATTTETHTMRSY